MTLSPLIVILGPTSSGKTRLAVELARKFKGEIISADSRQVYQEMDIGTGKDLEEYGTEKNRVPYHLIGIVKPTTRFTVARYQKLAYQKIEEILQRGKIPFLVGGTGLYIQAVVDGLVFPKAKGSPSLRKKLAQLSLRQLLQKLKKLDYQTYQTIDKKNRRRIERAIEICLLTGKPFSQQTKKQPPPYHILQIGLKLPKEILHKKIKKRLEKQFKDGLIEEVKKLHQKGTSWKRLKEFGLEYRYVSYYLRGQMSYQEMFAKLYQAIKDFAKRQMTWFKRDKRIHWIKNKKEAITLIKQFLSSLT
jgi:tRNA dimethylallyltransferase